jgi:hypothetical protein
VLAAATGAFLHGLFARAILLLGGGSEGAVEAPFEELAAPR